MTLATHSLGRTGPPVSSIGLGCMGMSPDWYGQADRGEAISTIHAALDAGINLFDTGDFYAMGHNEMLVGEALTGVARERAVVSVKFGGLREPAGGYMGMYCRPAAVKNFAAYSLKRLGLEHIDIYRPARLDPNVPIEDTVGAVADLIKAGYVRHLGLSEVSAETIRRAHAEHPVCDLQIEYSLISRGIEARILPACRELGIGVTAYGVLSRGLISGHWMRDRPVKGDWRSAAPRFQGDNLDTNLKLVEKMRALASQFGVSVAQLAIAWVAAQGNRSRHRRTHARTPRRGARRRGRKPHPGAARPAQRGGAARCSRRRALCAGADGAPRQRTRLNDR